MTALPRLRTCVPVAALLAVSASVFCTVPRVVAPALQARATPFDAVTAEARLCQRRSGRSWDDCVSETEGKSLIRDAERAVAGQPRVEAR